MNKEKLQKELAELQLHYDQKSRKFLRQRIDILQKAENDFRLRAIIMERCSRDVSWFFNMFITGYNPRAKPYQLLPFVLFPRQEDFLEWIQRLRRDGQWGAINKCRYTGASYIVCGYLLNRLLFERNFTGTLASNKADSVDKTNNSKCLFHKILDMYKRLPHWMKSFDMVKYKTRMQIFNPLTNSAIVGESGKEIGRGGRSTVAIVDEAAFIEHDTAMIGALSENTDCAIFVSTPNGVNNEFYRLCHSAEVSYFEYRWYADPRRSLDWRLKQNSKLGHQIAKQELDCCFDATNSLKFIEAAWVEAATNAHLQIPELLDYSDSQAGLDLALEGKDKTILAVRRGCTIEPLLELPQADLTQTTLTANEALISAKYPIQTLCYDADGIGAGVKGVLNNLDHPTPYSVIEFHGAGKPSDYFWDDREKTSDEFLYNKRAEAYYILRERLRKTYEHLNGLAVHNIQDLISIPEDNALRVDLLKPSYEWRNTKLLMESKINMRKRGLSSPDRADAVAYACYVDSAAGYWQSLGL